MPYTVDFEDDDAIAWSATTDGVTRHRDSDYTPTIYVAAPDVSEARGHLRSHPAVVGTGIEEWCRRLRTDPEPVCRVDVASINAVREVADAVSRWGKPGEYTCYNVDLSPEFRYCLESGMTPVPESRELTTLSLSLPEVALAEADLSALRIDGAPVEGTAVDAIEAVRVALAERDPDVLVLSTADLVPTFHAVAEQEGRPDIFLGRAAGYTKRAGESTYESYGQVGHSPARYAVPGRAIVDQSNSFFYRETNLAGLLDLVERSAKPLQEAAWASIGNVLTAIQIRAAMARDVLVPYRPRRHEFFKSMATLRRADRGGFTFSPDVGFHEDVHELDFASLYPNIMITRNVSPDTICCDCHADREDVPGLGYSICDRSGFIADVLEPIVADRAAYKQAAAATDDPDREAALSGRADALKWILVSCFGYQGFSNAKFGRIECHEAINAYAREILLDAKATLEAGGWRVVHGIVDSLWVQPRDTDRQPLTELAARVTDQTGIALEYEDHYEWIAFVPRQDSNAGALNRYFGATDEGFTIKGIEARQRSTPEYIEDCQRALITTLDTHRAPEPVLDQLADQLARLRAGEVDPDELVVRRRVSQERAAYQAETRTVAALERAERLGLPRSPGQDVQYVIVDDDASGAARVQLAHEPPTTYDREHYATCLVRAAESVLSPLGHDRSAIREYLADTTDVTLAAYATA